MRILLFLPRPFVPEPQGVCPGQYQKPGQGVREGAEVTRRLLTGDKCKFMLQFKETIGLLSFWSNATVKLLNPKSSYSVTSIRWYAKHIM